MQKKFIIALITLLFPLTAENTSVVKEEILLKQSKALDNLITITEKNLAAQKVLKQQIEEYDTLQKQYITSNDDRELLVKMTKIAASILTSIKENNLTHAFSREFLTEIALFAQVGSKRQVPKL